MKSRSGIDRTRGGRGTKTQTISVKNIDDWLNKDKSGPSTKTLSVARTIALSPLGTTVTITHNDWSGKKRTDTYMILEGPGTMAGYKIITSSFTQVAKGILPDDAHALGRVNAKDVDKSTLMGISYDLIRTATKITITPPSE